MKYKYCDIVDVSNDNKNWEKGIYIRYQEGEIKPHCILTHTEKNEIDFQLGEKVLTTSYKYARLNKDIVKIKQCNNTEVSDYR